MLMTPGPTEIHPEVREAMARPLQHPDLDPSFTDFYHALEEKLARVFDTEHDVLIPGGEAILGLEAAVASVIEPGDEVLCLSNGFYGESFADLVELYGGQPVICRAPNTGPLDEAAMSSLLDDHEFVAATMVHCETPTGLLNDLEGVVSQLRKAGVISIVDAVSSLGGTPVPADEIDLCLGGSQKCLSAPPGLTVLSVSDRAWEAVMETEPRSFYASLRPWRESWQEDEYFPYTHLVSNLYGLDAAVDRFLEEGHEAVFERHRRAAACCRDRGRDLGLAILPDEELASPTVTAFHLEGRAESVQQRLREEDDIVLATSLGDLTNDVLRVGHMGYNADVTRVEETMDALEVVLAESA